MTTAFHGHAMSPNGTQRLSSDDFNEDGSSSQSTLTFRLRASPTRPMSAASALSRTAVGTATRQVQLGTLGQAAHRPTPRVCLRHLAADPNLDSARGHVDLKSWLISPRTNHSPFPSQTGAEDPEIMGITATEPARFLHEPRDPLRSGPLHPFGARRRSPTNMSRDPPTPIITGMPRRSR